ncbi:MAG TPA: hypothetical protein VFK37_03145 [Bacillales bacterium]|nr:hypothetical protein [Bacillales bacterium]
MSGGPDIDLQGSQLFTIGNGGVATGLIGPKVQRIDPKSIMPPTRKFSLADPNCTIEDLICSRSHSISVLPPTGRVYLKKMRTSYDR